MEKNKTWVPYVIATIASAPGFYVISTAIYFAIGPLQLGWHVFGTLVSLGVAWVTIVAGALYFTLKKRD